MRESDRRACACAKCCALASVLLTFAVSDDGRPADDAFLYESGDRAPLITWGMLRALLEAHRDFLPSDFAELVEQGRGTLRAAGLPCP